MKHCHLNFSGKYKDNVECTAFIDMVIKDKHTCVKLNNQNNMNQKGKAKMKTLSDNTISDEKKKRYIENNNTRSENMKGEKNPNFGVERSAEHCARIALGTTLAKAKKRKFNDELINEIKAKLDDKANKISQVKLGELYGLSRTIISQINNGKIKTTDKITIDSVVETMQMKEENKRFTKGENVSRKKRKISADTVLEMIRYKRLNPDSTAVYIYKNSNELFKTEVTVDQVRQYLNRRTKLKQVDFDSTDKWTEYESYLNND